MIYICNLAELADHAQALRPSHLVSLVEAEQQPPTPAGFDTERHLRIEIHDIDEPQPGCVHPDRHHIRDLVQFVDGWPKEAPLLVHCVAGVSRSTAAALIALSIKTDLPEITVAQRLRTAAPHAQPNRRMVSLADEMLGRDGRLVAARDRMGPAVLTMRGPLVALAVH